MKNKQSVEDVLIGPNRPVTKKKSKAPVILTIFFILILIAGGVGAYYYYTNYILEKPKAKFFRYLATNNFSELLNNEVYNSIEEKALTQTNHSNLTVTATSNLNNLSDIDISKFNIQLNQMLDNSQNRKYAELKVDYAGNDLISVKGIKDGKSVGIASDEIADKYLGCSEENISQTINRILGIQTDTSIIENGIQALKTEKVDIDETYKKEKINEYAKIIENTFKEDQFTEKQNILITTDENNTLTANSYELKTSLSELNNLYSELLKNLRNDEEFLSKICVEDSNKVSNNTNTVQTDISNTLDVQNTNIDISPIGENTVLNEIENTSTNSETSFESISDDEADDEEIFSILLNTCLLGKKTDKTVEELQKIIDEEVTKVENSKIKDEEVKISIYVTDEKLKKIAIKSDSINTEIETLSEDNKEKIKITMLGVKDESTFANQIEENLLPSNMLQENNTINTEVDIQNTDIENTGLENTNTVGFTAIDSNTIDQTSTNSDDASKNGYTIKIEKNKTDMTTKISAEIGIVNNLEINTKLAIDLTTNGTTNSKEIKNEAIITYTNQEGQTIANINYNINFENATVEIPELTEENCLFLDTLNDEDLNNIMQQIMDRISVVMSEKNAKLNLIDQNNNSSVVEQGNTQNTTDVQAKEEAKQKLIEVISNMMGEAQTRGETFTLTNLANLQIEGYNVTVNITGNIAVITVNGYVFDLDSDFNLSEE